MIFPHNITIDEVRAAIAKQNEILEAPIFIESDKGNYSIFNYCYNVAGAFPALDSDDPLENRRRGIIRECRGLIMCKETGIPLARRMEKFFNISEKPETQIDAINWKEPHVVLNKLDGSFITPFRPHGSEEICFGSKMGNTEITRPMLEIAHQNNYINFSSDMINQNKTAVFEWCTRKNVIVILYDKEELILIAIRDNYTGEYIPYKQMVELGVKYNIPVVECVSSSVEEPYKFVETVKEMTGIEGRVVRFNNGLQLKQKCSYYVDRHRSKDLINSEKDVWRLILEQKVDDISSFLLENDRHDLERFETVLEKIMAVKSKEIYNRVKKDWEASANNKKTFALNYASQYDSRIRSIAFSITQGKDVNENFRNLLLKNCNTNNKIDTIRDLVDDVSWFNFHSPMFGIESE